jgi:hypothetical protein
MDCPTYKIISISSLTYSNTIAHFMGAQTIDRVLPSHKPSRGGIIDHHLLQFIILADMFIRAITVYTRMISHLAKLTPNVKINHIHTNLRRGGEILFFNSLGADQRLLKKWSFVLGRRDEASY